MKIHLRNRQRHLPVRPTAIKRLVQRLVQRAFPPDEPVALADLTLVLVDDEAMPDYKARCFGRRVQTDVVAQAYAAIPGVPPAAELILNAQRALVEGENHPGGPARELALYLAHGIDHLSGRRDDTPARRQAMRRRETAWLDTMPELVREVLRP